MSVDLNTSLEIIIFNRLFKSSFNVWLSPLPTSPLLYLLFVGLLLCNETANAQPSISNLQLSKSSTEFTVLTGSGFGQFDGKVLSWDHFDDKVIASSLDQAHAIEGNIWINGGSSHAVIDKQFSLSGGQSIKFDSSQGKVGFFGWKQKDLYKRLYLNYWQRMDGDIAKVTYQQLQLFGKSNSPQLRLGLADGKCWQLTDNLNQHIDVNPPDNCIQQTAGKFQHWALWIDLQTATIRAILDNQPLVAFTTQPNATDGVNEVRLGYEAEDPAIGSLWFDDVYIANTQARVEACSAPEYAQCSRRYLQYVAVENWKDNEIKLRLHNLRALRGESIYLYVIDSRGQVSNGIAIARPVIKAN